MLTDTTTKVMSAASAADGISRDELLCPICFDMLCFPVTLPCGHNFDRGCLLKAWAHDAPPASTELCTAHACPLCRRRSGAARADDLHVNLLLKTLISAQFPVEMRALESSDKLLMPSAASAATAAGVGGGRGTGTGTGAADAAPSARRRRSWRTAASFFYVWLASVTEPPGFVLAVLLLMSLVAIAVTPQQMLTNASTLPTLFDGLDHLLNAFLLLIREIGLHMDQLDQVWPWMQVFSFVL